MFIKKRIKTIFSIKAFMYVLPDGSSVKYILNEKFFPSNPSNGEGAGEASETDTVKQMMRGT